MQVYVLVVFLALLSCNPPAVEPAPAPPPPAPETVTENMKDTVEAPRRELPFDGQTRIETGQTTPSELLAFAHSLVGTPYKYASTDPGQGFDCSGFITYVFNHFNISVPRSSVSFTNIETEVDVADARPGDLILFTGTDSTVRVVGHMGIVSSINNGQLEFIHSSSGKANGVTITPLNPYYQGRFVKVIRIFPENRML